MIILIGQRAKRHLEKVLEAYEIDGVYENPTEIFSIGYFKEGNFWVAFDGYCGYTIEEFDTEEEAIKYAKGLLAKTKGGFQI